MFVDAAALVAILSGEPEAARCGQAIDNAPAAFTSALAVWEAAMALARRDKLAVAVDQANDIVLEYLFRRNIELRDFPPAEATLTLTIDAAARFRNNRVRLNLADCFHYACARHHDAAILSTANEFRLTDLRTVP